MITLYGIPNCDTVKKAKTWLDDQNIPYQFHDFRKDGLNNNQVNQWVKSLGLDTLINKRSTSWKALSDSEKSSLSEATAAELIMTYPTLIKRPLLDNQGTYQVGFKPAQYEQIFS